MKLRSQIPSLLLATTFMVLLMGQGLVGAPAPKADRGEIYQRFGELLDEMNSEGARENEFQTIRANAAELIKRGQAVVSFGRGELPRDFQREGARALRGLDRALNSFKGAARTGSDARVKQSLTAVRESWDELATLYLGCALPPPVTVNCPADTTAGGKVEVVANGATLEGNTPSYSWTLSEGKIAEGQGSRTIVVPTAGLGGKTIRVEVTIDDGAQHTATVFCTFKVLNP